MSKHTPGPWQFAPLTWRGEPTIDGLGYIRPQDEDGKEICHHGDMDRPGEENRANGLLMAAAPDLLAALKLILASHDIACPGEECRLSGVDAARFAIAKATGDA